MRKQLKEAVQLFLTALFVFAWQISISLASELIPDLYRGETIVTGRDNLAERTRGLRENLLQVFIKVSGDASLSRDSRLSTLLDKAETFTTFVDYEDRHGNKKIHHEQGTRDRSFILRADFNPAQIDDSLKNLGRKTWGPIRPKILILFGVRDNGGEFVLRESGDRGYSQREALLSAAIKAGLPIILPSIDTHEKELSFSNLKNLAKSHKIGSLAGMAEVYKADVILLSIETLSSSGYWSTMWSLIGKDKATHWQIKNTTFDRSIQNSLQMTAQKLSDFK